MTPQRTGRPLAVAKNPVAMRMATSSAILGFNAAATANLHAIGFDGSDHVAIDYGPLGNHGTLFGGYQAIAPTTIVVTTGLQSNINISGYGNVRISASGAFSIGGFTGGFAGRILYVCNTIATMMWGYSGPPSSLNEAG